MKFRISILIITCAIHLVPSVAPAATILTGPGDFTAPTTLVDFETFPGGGIVPYNAESPGILGSQWRSLGVLISDGSPQDGAGAYSATFDAGPHSGTRAISDSSGGLSMPGGSLHFAFIDPNSGQPMGIPEAGLWIENGDSSPSDVRFFGVDGSLLQTINVGGGDTFVGLRASEGVGGITINDSGYFMADDLQFTVVPEPSELSLLAASGLAACMGLRMRNNHKNRHDAT